MLRLKSIRIDKLRKVQPGTVLNFTGDTNLVLGKNGVGKTTLLDVIACAVKLDFSAFANEEVDVAVELVANEESSETTFVLSAKIHHTKVTSEQAQHPPQIVSVVELSCRVGMSTFAIQIANGKVAATEDARSIVQFDVNPIVYLSANPILETVVEAFEKIRKHLIKENRIDTVNVFDTMVLLLNTRKAHARLDESLDVIRAGMTKLGNIWIDTTIFAMSENLSAPKDFASALISGVTLASTELIATSENVDFFAEFARLVAVELVTTKFYRQRVDDYGNERKLTFHNQNFFIIQKNSELDFEQFSYGQKRLLAILQYLAVNQEIVVADEITNGLHHEWIKFIVKKLEGRQCFLTSQNPVLLDFLTFTSAAETKNRLIRCEHGLNGTLIWRNLTDEEANDFYSSYETGMQHVGEIMRKQGLW